jgi:hypothetical protein
MTYEYWPQIETVSLLASPRMQIQVPKAANDDEAKESGIKFGQVYVTDEGELRVCLK